jgi:hypothetical protein
MNLECRRNVFYIQHSMLTVRLVDWAFDVRRSRLLVRRRIHCFGQVDLGYKVKPLAADETQAA